MKKILILTASFGDGHNAAARNLRDALELLADDASVQVLDLLESSYGLFNTLMKRAYQGLVRYAPALWSGVFSVLDSPTLFSGQLRTLGRLRDQLAQVLHEFEPDVVVSTYPVYSHLIQEIYQDHDQRPFPLITVVTDSITICSAWYTAPSDTFVVANAPTADVLVRAGVPRDALQVLGFPVSMAFATQPLISATREPGTKRWKVLYVINTGKAKAGKSIERLLRIPELQLTITVGRDASLKAKLAKRLRPYGDRVRLFGWTNDMPKLLLSHDLLIGKAGGAMIQEAIAACCPVIVNQVIPGQEEGNAELVRLLDFGRVARKKKDVRHLVEKAFANRGHQLMLWKENLARISQPDSSVRIANFVLQQSNSTNGRPRQWPSPVKTANPIVRTRSHSPAQVQLCDFHIHTNYSDGQLTLPEVVDFYGQRGFDCICITDHVADPRRLIGKCSELLRLTVPPQQQAEYFEVIERERRRAWRKYRMHLMAGVEFNKEGFRKKTSGHLLGIDLKTPITPSLDFVETIVQIHAQGGLAVAAHPHIMKSEWGKNTLFLWENQEIFAPLIDAWEIANRNNIFTPIGLKRLAYLANTDFHKPKHIYSWVSLLHCEKDPEAIKECVRKNERVSLTRYHDGLSGAELRAEPRILTDTVLQELPLDFAWAQAQRG